MNPWAAGVIGLIFGFCLGVIAAALCVGSTADRFPISRQEPAGPAPLPPSKPPEKLAPKPRAKRSVKHGR